MRRRHPRTIGRGERSLIIQRERDPQFVTHRSSRSSLSTEHVVSEVRKKKETTAAKWDDRGEGEKSAFRSSTGLIARSRACDPRYALREHDGGVAINLSAGFAFAPPRIVLLGLRFPPARNYEDMTKGRIARWRAGCSTIIQTSSWFARE